MLDLQKHQAKNNIKQKWSLTDQSHLPHSLGQLHKWSAGCTGQPALWVSPLHPCHRYCQSLVLLTNAALHGGTLLQHHHCKWSLHDAANDTMTHHNLEGTKGFAVKHVIPFHDLTKEQATFKLLKFIQYLVSGLRGIKWKNFFCFIPTSLAAMKYEF